MSSARAIVCEKSDKWIVALRRVLLDHPLKLLETRSLHACWQELADAPASFVMLECLSPELKELLGYIKRLTTRFPRARVAVLCNREMETYQWLIRQAGAAHVVFSTRQLDALIRILRHHLASVPNADTSNQQRIWEQLPWSATGARRRAQGAGRKVDTGSNGA